MKSRLAIVGSLLLCLPVGATELEQLRETNRQQAARIRSLEQEVRQLKGIPSMPSQSAEPNPSADPVKKTYAIRPGDNLSSIAKAHKITVKELLAVNPGIKPNRLRPGQSVALSAEPEAPPAPAPSPAAIPSGESAAPAALPTSQGRTGIVRVMIENTTTAGEFAARHQTNIARLNELNGLDLTDASVLAKGSELLCPGK